MKTIDFVRFGSALCLMILPAAVAGAQSMTDPAPIVTAFNETCRRGFPNLDTIRQRAESQGWIRRSFPRFAEDGRKLRTAALPYFLQKGGMMLVMSAPYKRRTRSSCLISVRAEGSLDNRGLAEAVSAALGVGQASVVKERGVVSATWHVNSGMVVTASVIESGGIRMANLAVLTS